VSPPASNDTVHVTLGDDVHVDDDIDDPDVAHDASGSASPTSASARHSRALVVCQHRVVTP
jgi:hypothetical protein